MTSEQLALPVQLATAIGPTLHRVAAAMAPAEVVELIAGWATVELDRAESELAGSAGGSGPPSATPLLDDAILGSRTRRLASDGRTTILLEPSTEGRLAAALASHGEGWTAAYVLVSGADGAAMAGQLAAAGLKLSAEAPGPLGPERLVLGGPRDGPFVLLVVLGP
jgi:hypothetical protein